MTEASELRRPRAMISINQKKILVLYIKNHDKKQVQFHENNIGRLRGINKYKSSVFYLLVCLYFCT